MLVLSRNVDESIVINGNIVVTVVRVEGGKVRIGVKAPKNITLDREEIHERKQYERQNAKTSG